MVFAIIGVFLLNVYILLPMLIRPFLSKRLSAIVKKSGCTCLTFDDGPDPESTPEILSILRQAGAKATFFVLGEKVEQNPDLVARIVDEEHELGEHSYRHLHPWKCNPLSFAADLLKGGRSLKEFRLPKNSVFFRPPYGKSNLITLLYVLARQMHIAFWDIDSKDYQECSGEKVAQTVIDQLHLGSIVLLHDGRRNASTNSNPVVTVSALKLIIEATKKSGLRLTTISEAVSKGCR